MPKFSALKLIDQVILPVVIVFTSKIASAFLVCLVFGIVWEFNSPATNQSLFFLSFENFEDLYVVNSFSDFMMILVTAFGFSWVLFRGIFFGENNLHPVTAAKLHKKNHDFLIASTTEVYHQAAVWLSLSWVVLFFVFNNVLNNATSYLNLGISMATTATLTITLGKIMRVNQN